MALVTTQDLPDAGAVITMAAAAATDTVKVGANMFLFVYNGGGSDTIPTITVPGNTEYGEADPDHDVTVATTQLAIIPLLPEYRDGSTLTASFSAWANVTSVTRAVVYMPQ